MLGTIYTIEDLKDVRGVWRTATLFEETCTKDLITKYPPIFSMVDQEYSKSGLPSLKYRYLEVKDTNEYLFAETFLGGWDHWQMVTKSWILKPYIGSWREELKLKLRSEYLKRVQDLAEGSGPASLQALKYLMEIEAGGTGGAKRGRPSKLDKERLLNEEVQEDREQREEATRLGLN